MLRVVMFSSGVGSWAAARRVADRHGTGGLVLLFCDVRGDGGGPHDGEDEDNYRFLREAAQNIGGDLVVVRDGRSVWDVFNDEHMIGNSRVAPCSKRLKQEPARKWIHANCDPERDVLYVGIDWSESHRLPAIEKGWSPFSVEAPLTAPPYLDKGAMLKQLRLAGIEPPRLYSQGFAHANCGGFCVRAGHGHFKTLLLQNPDRYAYHAAREQEFRERFQKNVAILRDRSGGVSTPLTLLDLQRRINGGEGEVDDLDIGGCGCFTGEDTSTQ